MLEEILKKRRDTRHFTAEAVPDDVLQKALMAGHLAPSVGLTEATRYYLIRSGEVKSEIKKLFDQSNSKAYGQISRTEQKEAYAALKLEAITDAPVGLVVCYDRSVLADFTIGTVASNDTVKFSSVCAVQNIWLSLTEQGYSMGWVSILHYNAFKKLLGLPEEVEPLGYFCIGKPATDYDQQPMLQQVGWKEKGGKPLLQEIDMFIQNTSAPAKSTQEHEGPNESLQQSLQHLIDYKTKPIGALGMLEALALQIGTVFETTTPVILQPHLIVFAADHGIAQHGVSAYPPEVTAQMVVNFTVGGAAINVFCRQHNIQLIVVDAGVNYDFSPSLPLVNQKIGRGTHSFLHRPAMERSQMEECLSKGAHIVQLIKQKGCNTIGFGEMGIGNTSAAAVLMSILCDIPIEECIGRGTGVTDEKLAKKHQLLKRAIDSYDGEKDVYAALTYFGGFEIAQMTGAMLEAYQHRMLILVDGFISTVAFLCAYKMDAAVKRNAVFCHQSGEHGHKLLLEYLDAMPLLQLNMRLGEGTGCAVAFPLLQSAVAFLREMASFEMAGISHKV